MSTALSPTAPRRAPAAHRALVCNAAIDLRPGSDRHLQVVATSPHTELGGRLRQLECEVFQSSFGSTVEEHAAHYDVHDAASTFFGVVDRRDGAVLGAARVVAPSSRELASVSDMREAWAMSDEVIFRPAAGVEVPAAATWDIATLAVDPGHRDGIVSHALYQAVCTSAYLAGIDHFVAILDAHVHRLLKWHLRNIFTAYPVAPRPFGGSLSIPVWADLAAFRRRNAAQAPELVDRLFFGARMDHVAPVAWDDLLAEVRTAPTPVPA